MKKLILIFAALFCVALYGEEITIAKDGKAVADIVIAENAKPMVRFAAQELKKYLEAITSAKFSITSKPTKKINFYLGMGDASKFKNQQFMINVKGDRIELYGVDGGQKFSYVNMFFDYDQKGTLTAVYNFLDDIGVRWLAPGEQNTYIPEKKTLRINEYTRNFTPVFKDRQTTDFWRLSKYLDAAEYTNNVNDVLLWGLRNNMSVRNLVAGCHTEQVLQLYKNPEWLKHKSAHMLSANGKRNPKYSCWTDPYTKEVWLRAVDGYFSGKTPAQSGFPGLSKYSLSLWPFPLVNPDEFMIDPMDHTSREDGRCRCQRCQDTRKKLDCEGDDSEILWNFIADVAEYVNKKYPGKYITTLVYPPKVNMPKTVKLPENIRVRICLTGARSALFPERLAKDIQKAKLWSDHCGREYTPLWTYQCINHGRYLAGVPDIYPRLMSKYINAMKPYIAGMFNERYNMSHTYRNYDVYLYMRLIFDPSRDVEKEIAEYHKLYYGPAAASAKELFDYFEKQWLAIDRRLHNNKSDSSLGIITKIDADKARKIVWSEIYDVKSLKYIDSIIKRMEKETASAPQYNKRVMHLRKYLFDIMSAERAEIMDKADIRATIKIQAAPTKSATFPSAEEWAKVAPAKLISAVRMTPILKAETTFKLLASKDYLYILVDDKDKDIEKSRTQKNIKNGNRDIWRGNCVEFFFTAVKSKRFWHILVNDNNVWSSETQGRVLMRWQLMPGAKIRSYRTAEGFRVEAAIPLEQLKTDGNDLRMNVTRERNVGKDPTEYATWSKLGMVGNWYNEENYGSVEFK